MTTFRGLRLDDIGPWSEIKLVIVKAYAAAYAKILAKQRFLKPVYIDAFAGAGLHLAKTSGALVAGSPLNALHVSPRFHEYHFIDLDNEKLDVLRNLVGDQHDVYFYGGDCNDILLTTIFPTIGFSTYRKGLCLLDPYGLHLRWEVLAKAGELRTIELFLNFPMMDMNRNALWRDPAGVATEDVARMTAFWGDGSWKDLVYQPSQQQSLFGGEPALEKVATNDAIAAAFRKRLSDVARFAHVPDPLPMRNEKNAVVYYLYFAGPNKTGAAIASDIFNKHRQRLPPAAFRRPRG